MFCPIFAPLKPHKTNFAAVFYICMCVRTLYIGETPKSVLFAVYIRLHPFSCSVCMLVLYFVFGTFAAVFFLFSLAFCFTKIMCETLCKFLYVYARLICIFMHSIMINRNVFGIFTSFPHLCRNVLSFYFFTSRFFCYFG